ncbi:hypothetical protein [Streptomyces sp. NPDC001275]
MVVAQLLVEGFVTPLRCWLVVPVALVGGAFAGWRGRRGRAGSPEPATR